MLERCAKFRDIEKVVFSEKMLEIVRGYLGLIHFTLLIFNYGTHPKAKSPTMKVLSIFISISLIKMVESHIFE